nr:copia protein [Tanacetum cinerariifolium]GEW31511.1 copia protein [Tanacetum cinerariifolium]
DLVFSRFLTITLLEQLKSPSVAPKADRGKEIVTEDAESPKKLVKASRKFHPDPDEPVRAPYEIHGKLYHLTNDEINTHLDREKKIKRAVEEAKLLAMTKSELIKVVHKEASKAGIDPKFLESGKGVRKFKKIQNAEMKVLNKEHSQKVKKAMEFKKKKINNYIVTKLDELGTIIQSKMNRIIRRKRKIIDLDLEIRIPRLECNRSLPEGVLLVTNTVIEEPEYGMFFINVFGDKAFQRMSDIHKIDVETLPTYLVMASNITTPGFA